MIISTIILIVPGALELPSHTPSMSALLVIVLLGSVCTGATLALFYRLISTAGPARAALAFYLSPGFAVIFGAAFLREPITAAAALGLVLIVAGSALASRRQSTTL